MKWLSIIVKNLLRSRRRTVLTVITVALALFIFTMLQTVLAALAIRLEGGLGETRLAVIEKYAGPRRQLPIHYQPQLDRFEHVTAVTPTGYTFFTLGRDEALYVALLVDPATYREVFASTVLTVDPRAYEQFVATRNGVLVGTEILRKYGWTEGDRIVARSIGGEVELPLVICGALPAGPGGQPLTSQLLVNAAYYKEAQGEPWMVNIFWLRLESPAHVLPVMQAVADYYRDGPQEVSVETEGSMLARLTSFTATIELVIQVIATVVFGTILAVAANTIALSMRERRKELALMKAVGFTPRRLLTLVVAESVATSLAGGAIGTGLAFVLFTWTGVTLSLGLTFDFIVTPRIVATGLVVSLLIGVLSSLLPAYNASRIKVIQVLHSL